MRSLSFFFLFASFVVSAQNLVMSPLQTRMVAGTDEHLKQYQVLQFNVGQLQRVIDNIPGNVKELSLNFPDRVLKLQLFEYSIIHPEYIRKAASSGDRHLPLRKDFRTFKGFVSGDNQSKVALYIADDFLKITLYEKGERYFVEPLDEGSLNPDYPASQQFLYYKNSDVVNTGQVRCGMHNDADEAMTRNIEQQVAAAVQSKPCFPCAEVKICLAADNIMFRKYGSDVAKTENQMMTILADVQTVYDDEFENEYSYQVTGTYVADDPSKDPWRTLNDINAMLAQFGADAPNIFSGSQYNVATLWTSKFGPLGEVGAAVQASICTVGDPVNVCSDYWAPGGRQPDYLTLQAHMLGHNWSMIHDRPMGGTIMAPGLPNGSTLWSFLSKDALNSYVKMYTILERKCLTTCPNSQAPVPDFVSDVTYGCQPVTVKFKDLSTNTTKWKWKFPGGMPDTSILQNPIVVYKTPGIYPVSLEAGNSRCDVTLTKTDYIEINDKPRADFSWGIQGREVFFIDQCQRAVEYFWNFGDGETSEEANPYHVYYTDSTYEVTLTVRNDCGENTLKKTIVIVSIPTADFDADTVGTCAPGSIHFKDMSTPNVKTWQWEFPGGVPGISTQKNPVIRYDLPGVYDVRLTVYSSRFNSSLTKKAFVLVDSTPIAAFKDSVDVGTVYFTQLSRYGKNHEWIFKDGKDPNNIIGRSTDANPTFVFKEGDYDVCYITSNGCGRDTAYAHLTIGTKPVVSFASDRSTGCAPYKIQYQNNSQSANSYRWTFPGGNPATSTDPNPLVTYPTKGKFDVKLVASNTFYSDSLTKKDFVEVRTKPDANFDLSITGFKVFFTNQTIDGTNYIWDFGDRKASFEQNPVHDYGVEGEFDVKLIVSNTCGVDTFIRHIAVYLIPKVNFAANVISGCPPLKVQFSDRSSVDVNQWDWQFESGNPAVSNEKNPIVVFDKQGKFAVKLTAKNTNGANSLTRVQYITVLSPIECPEHTKSVKELLDEKIIEHPFGEVLNSRLRTKETNDRDRWVYPNPAGTYFELKISPDFGEVLQLELYKITGELCHAQIVTPSNAVVQTSQMEAGSYILCVSNGTLRHFEKVMIMK